MCESQKSPREELNPKEKETSMTRLTLTRASGVSGPVKATPFLWCH